jgi:hypothetical protein
MNYSGSKVSGTVGLPVGEKKYPSRTCLNSGRVRVPLAGKKSSMYPYLSGRVPVPELPSLIEVGLSLLAHAHMPLKY